ncbi:MAG: hypothetical protein ACMVO3_23445 [Thalassobaculum sp.]
MEVIRDRATLLDWLAGKSPQLAVALATRTALRFLPLVATDKSDLASANVVLPTFRAVAAAWLAGMTGVLAEDLGDAASCADAAAAATSEPKAAFAADSAAAAARVALASSASDGAGAAKAAFNARVAFDLGAAAGATSAVGPKEMIWAPIDHDVDLIENGYSPRKLLQAPLWSGEPYDEILIEWRKLNKNLRDLQENWEVWLDWYSDRLSIPFQRPLIEPLEVDRVVKLNEKDWQEGPSHINSIILELEFLHRKPDDSPEIIEGSIRLTYQTPTWHQDDRQASAY